MRPFALYLLVPAVRSDLKCERGDVSAVKGLRLSASVLPGLTLKRLLEEAGIDFQRDNVRLVASPRRISQNWAWDGVDAIEQGVADGYWGNGLRADLGVKRGIAKILLDVRRGDGPPRPAPGLSRRSSRQSDS